MFVFVCLFQLLPLPRLSPGQNRAVWRAATVVGVGPAVQSTAVSSFVDQHDDRRGDPLSVAVGRLCGIVGGCGGE